MQSTASNLEFKLNVNLRLVKPDFMQSTAVNLELKLKVIFKLLSCNRPMMFTLQVKYLLPPSVFFSKIKAMRFKLLFQFTICRRRCHNQLIIPHKFLSVTYHITCIVVRYLINVVYLTACTFIRS